MTATSYSKLAVDAVASGDQSLDALRESIAAYCRKHHRFEFDPAHPVVRLHEPTFGAEEIIAAAEVLLSTRVTMGPMVRKFEQTFAAMHGIDKAVSNNSGSSANLLAIAALSNIATENGWRPGDEVIVPALSWSTTVWPLIQHNLVPVIVDIDPRTFNMDPNEVERAIGPKTRGVMPVHVYGNPCDMRALHELCERRGLIMLEDCCEALGATYEGKAVGSFGVAGTFSFYFSHHITTLEGGICVTNDFELAETMRILRAHGWTRELENRQKYLTRYPDIDPRFLFVNLGYNLRMTELQAAIGLVQLPKLAGFVETRRENSEGWSKDFSRWKGCLDFQLETPGARSSCFGFPLVVKETAPFDVQNLAVFLGQVGIETRAIIAGNIAMQPGLKLYQHRVVGDLSHSTLIMRRGLSIGNHQAVGASARQYVTAKMTEFMSQYGLR
jgi:CDP-6-deoxy-D-xylo-4-hexulose-3-dehydrase